MRQKSQTRQTGAAKAIHKRCGELTLVETVVWFRRIMN